MEILIGFLSGTIVFIYYYNDYLEKEKKLQCLIKFLKAMDEKNEDRIWNKIEKIEESITSLKISIAKLKTKVAYISGIFSFGGALIFAIVKEFVFK